MICNFDVCPYQCDTSSQMDPDIMLQRQTLCITVKAQNREEEELRTIPAVSLNHYVTRCITLLFS